VVVEPTSQMSRAHPLNKCFQLVTEFVAFFCVMPMVPVEAAILVPRSGLRRKHHPRWPSEYFIIVLDLHQNYGHRCVHRRVASRPSIGRLQSAWLELGLVIYPPRLRVGSWGLASSRDILSLSF
jgi:hypothetical protein